MTSSSLSNPPAIRDNNFDLIRHLAATGVLVSHAFPIALGRSHPDPIQETLNGVTIGSLCVAAFFAISGFLVTASWQRFEIFGGVTGFLIARSLRIFPGLFVAALFTVILGAALSTAPMVEYLKGAAVYIVRAVTLISVSQQLPGLFETNPMDFTVNGSLWTLFYEFSLYIGIVIAGLFGLLWRKKVVLAGLPLLFALYVTTDQIHISDRIHSISLLGIPFSVGVLAWLWRDEFPISVGLLLISWVSAWASLGSAISEPTLFLAVAVSTLYLGHLRALPVKWPSHWGDMSYGIYIYAFPVQQTATSFGAHDPVSNIVFALPATIILAWLSWRLIENPALSLKRQWRLSIP